MSLPSESKTIALSCIFSLILELVDYGTDMKTVVDSYQSASRFLNHVAAAQLISVLTHSIISCTILISRTYKHNVRRLYYGSLWGSILQMFATLIIYMSGLGCSILRVDLLIDILHGRTKYLAVKQTAISIAELLHVLLESLPQSIIQASIHFFGDEYICIDSRINDGFYHGLIAQSSPIYSGSEKDTSQLLETIHSRDALLYSLNHGNITVDACACEFEQEIDNENLATKYFEQFWRCSWNKPNYFPIISTLASAFSVVFSALKYSAFNRIALSYDCKYVFGFIAFLLVLFCNYCFSIYLIYIHVFFFSPYSVLLLPLVFFLLYPSPTLKRILNQIRTKTVPCFTSNDTLALSISLGIFCFLPLFCTFSQFSHSFHFGS